MKYNKSSIEEQSRLEGLKAAKCFATNITKCLKNAKVSIREDKEKDQVWLDIDGKRGTSSTRFDDGWDAWMGLSLIEHFMQYEMHIDMVKQSMSDR